MGDRGNVYVHEGDRPGVYLYAHWSGSTLPEVVRHALARSEDRWADTQYLARIIFDDMVGPSRHGELTGFGISAQVQDGDDRVVDVDTARLEVRVGDRRVGFRQYVNGGETSWAG